MVWATFFFVLLYEVLPSSGILGDVAEVLAVVSLAFGAGVDDAGDIVDVEVNLVYVLDKGEEYWSIIF